MHVLGVQLLGDARGRRRQIGGVADHLGASAGLVRDLLAALHGLTRVLMVCRTGGVDGDGIDEGVGPQQRRAQIAERHVARGVGAVRDDAPARRGRAAVDR